MRKFLPVDEHEFTWIISNRIGGICRLKSFSHLRSSAFICGLLLLLSAFIFCFHPNSSAKVSAEDLNSEIKKAIFTRQEFFGATAIVPLPTSEARENLLKLAQNNAENPLILERLAEFDEKLENYESAEKNLIRLSEIDRAKIDALGAFYHRHGWFEKEAEVLRKVLFTAENSKRREAFENLLDLARIHDLKTYQNADFYAKVVAENPNSFSIFKKLIIKLVEEKNYDEALKFTRQAQAQFPDKKSFLLKKEVEILLEADRDREAETVYVNAFDPLWSDDEADRFYSFLSDRDRLREYGSELKSKFKKNPADFETGIKLALYQDHDYSYGNDEITPIILEIEAAKKSWTVDELTTATRLLLKNNDGATASRFLYTLYLREDFLENSAQRERVLYQLFKMFVEAETEKLPISKGDLRFYGDVAASDTNPGIATGILSLIFADTNPKNRLAEQGVAAAKFFNRAAAFRVFEEYKKESEKITPTLGQMYLDLINLYVSTKEPEIAQTLLNEYSEKFENSTDYAEAAMKLAAAFSAMKNEEKAREIYQKVLDYTGKQGKSLAPQNDETEEDEETESQSDYSTSTDGYSSYREEETKVLSDYLTVENSKTTYSDALEIYVDSLAKEKKTAEILALYSDEITKYPDEEWLYEKRLAWLEQTNLLDEQLRLYQETTARFQTADWRDKLARFFIREKRNDDFARLSEDLVGKLNDAEVQKYLSQFVDGNVSAGKFEEQLYLKLYQTAHARFPENENFTDGLLKFYRIHKMETEWDALAAENYFESKAIRESYLNRLSETGELREFLQAADGKDGIVYELFRADASARLSDFENAIDAYRKLNKIYPHTPEFAERFVVLTRSLGQKDRQILIESAAVSEVSADYEVSSAAKRTRSGEIFAELGDYQKSGEEWENLIATASGTREIYLDTATVYWDYFQFNRAFQTIKNLRGKFSDLNLYAFEAGAILESQKKTNDAIAEYVKAFHANGDEEQKEKTVKRLAKLAAKSDENLNAIKAAFTGEISRRKDDSFPSLGYAKFLSQAKQNEQAEAILNRAVANSRDNEFLEAAQNFYQIETIQTGEQKVLQRLAEIADNPRRSIRFRLRLAKSFAENQQRNEAKQTLENTVRAFPTNYGVLTETSDVYWRIGFETEAIKNLQTALPKSKGAFQNALAAKLSDFLIRTNQLDSAERTLTKLHAENPSDAEIFRQLAKVCVRTKNAALLRNAFDETVKALRASNQKDRRFLDDQIADLRVSMIDAFTRTNDYKSAVEQHIEIINREPENEELTENAVRYVKRYGGAEVLRDYYLKLSAEAFKNYRWNVVLARIYEAENDTENAVKNYEAAIVNHPEMPELYLAIADLETKRENYDAALQKFDTILELTNDAPEYVKKKIEILKRAGKTSEIETEKAKLPREIEQKVAEDEFAKAAKIAVEDKEKRRALYREAFARLAENPLYGEMKTADISASIQAMREDESLASITQNLLNLREKLIEISEANDSTDAGEARKRLETLNSAVSETVGGIAKNYGTDEELAALHEILRLKIETVSIASDRHQTLFFVQNLSVRAGFGNLERMILQKRIDEALRADEKKFAVYNLVDFYNERGAYQEAFDVLERYAVEDLPLRAEAARSIGDREKELAALRQIYWKPLTKFAETSDKNIARFLEILYSDDRAELESVAAKSSSYQLQTINFLLGKGERELAHSAIENADFPLAWKASRHAETSLALREFEEASECFFCAALRFDSIGNLIAQTPDRKSFLINDDWFRLSREYGEWLYEKQDREASKFLPALVENTPKNSEQQFTLGEFYLQKKEYAKAVEHLNLAIEIDNFAVADAKKLTTLGAALYLKGDEKAARDKWTKVWEADETLAVEKAKVYFDALRKYDLDDAAREKMPLVIIKFLENADAEDSTEFQELIRKIAASFDNEAEKAEFFRRILQQRKTDKSLAAMLLNENLIVDDFQTEFYELIISRYEKISYGDYEFSAFENRFFGDGDAEAIYEQEKNYQTKEPDEERIEWQRKYLEWLLKRGDTTKTFALVAEIERDLKGFYVRPAWLGLAKINAQIRAGKFDAVDAEKFVGIIVPDAATEIKAPNLERFNEVHKLLIDAKRNAEAVRFAESFFARRLALGEFNAGNFSGFARVNFNSNQSETGLRVLQLMVDASDEAKGETVLAEISAFPAVKDRTADAAKIESAATNVDDRNSALRFAAEISEEFDQIDAAISFRRLSAQLDPNDSENKIKLAELLGKRGENVEAREILTGIINDKTAFRAARWQARTLLRTELPNREFDSLSQFYNGIANIENGRSEAAFRFFKQSLIANKDAALNSRQELIKLYATFNQPFAALKIAAADGFVKSEETIQILSESAEKTGDFQKAIEFEEMKANGANGERIAALQMQLAEKNRRATDFTIDKNNTRNL